MAAVSFELRQYSDTISYLEQALASTERPLDATMRADATRLLARVRAFVAEITIELEPSMGSVAVDGADPRQISVQRGVLLDVGDHKLAFSAPGYVGQERSISVQGDLRLHDLQCRCVEIVHAAPSQGLRPGVVP